jgi:hypothetical protein
MKDQSFEAILGSSKPGMRARHGNALDDFVLTTVDVLLAPPLQLQVGGFDVTLKRLQILALFASIQLSL